MAAMNPALPSARHRLGEAIQKHITAQRKTDLEIADRCGCPAGDVARFRAGTLVPERQTWTRMCQMVAKSLFSYQTLYREAMSEQEAEQELMLRGLRSHQVRSAPTPATPDQPAAVIPIKPEPAPGAPAEQETPAPAQRRPEPPGSRSTAQIELRRNYVREQLRLRPHRKASGDDGIVTEVREVFGVGISPAEVEAIRREVVREVVRELALGGLAQPGHRADNPAAYGAQPAAPAIAPAPATPPAATSEADIAAAVAIVIDAIPGLRRMVIEQDPAGNVTYTHEVHAVQHGSGTLQGRR